MDLVTESPTKRRKKANDPRRAAHRALWRAFWKSPTDLRRNRLVEAYHFLVREVVQRFSVRLPRSVDRGDLQTAGSVGLMAAIASFDPGRNVRFEVYGEARIRGAILDELRQQDWLPRPWRTRIDQRKRTLEALRARLGREPTGAEAAAAMGLAFEEYELLFGTVLPGAPGGSMPRADTDEPASRLDGVEDPRSGLPGEALTRAEILRLVAQRMTALEYRIVYLKYWEDLSMKEIGQLTHLSESRVCKIHAKLMERLKDRFASPRP
jgi:RNA polymerase sigma factor for flagellar operon FliA